MDYFRKCMEPVEKVLRDSKISKAQVRKIAEEKLKDLNTRNVEAAMRVVEGTARSMGVTVEG